MNLGRFVRETPLPELGDATTETAPTGAESATPAGGRPAPVLIGDVVAADCAELRDMAEWFDQQGKKSNGDFLRAIAHRHEILFGAYCTKTKRDAAESGRELTVEDMADCGMLSELDD